MIDKRPERYREDQPAWDEHNLSQLKYFRSLSLREKLEAVEGMADLVRRLQQMRASGELRSAAKERKHLAPTRPYDPTLMNMQPLNSSAIARAGYDPDREVLRLEYTSGKLYEYYDVSDSVFEALLDAPSAGEFVNESIKPFHSYAEITG